MNTLIINPGSSNVKFRFYRNNDGILNGLIENKNKSMDDIGKVILSKIRRKCGVRLDKIAYRVVYSGKIKKHCIIIKKVLSELKKTAELDPNHMPNTIKLIEYFMRNVENAGNKKTEKTKHIACFDTVFHNVMPPVSRIYAIPIRLTKKYNIQRFGFHGLAHQAMAEKARLSRVITCQLGNGVSISAVKNGRCIDTSMGFTPLEGLMMGTRSGNIDPYLVYHLCRKEKKSPDQITGILQKESGLKGIADESDMRKILKRKDSSARLAVEMFCYAVKKQIGAYIAALNGVDCIVLSGGISHSSKIRQKILSGLPKTRVLVYDADEQEVMLKISKRF